LLVNTKSAASVKDANPEVEVFLEGIRLNE